MIHILFQHLNFIILQAVAGTVATAAPVTVSVWTIISSSLTALAAAEKLAMGSKAPPAPTVPSQAAIGAGAGKPIAGTNPPIPSTGNAQTDQAIAYEQQAATTSAATASTASDTAYWFIGGTVVAVIGLLIFIVSHKKVST